MRLVTLCCGTLRLILAGGLALLLPEYLSARDVSIHNQQMSVTVRSQDGSYEIRREGEDRPVIRAVVGAEIDHEWVRSANYREHVASQSAFHDELGSGQRLTVTSRGWPSHPDLTYVVRLYDSLPFGDIEVELRNLAAKPMTVQSIRSVEAIGEHLLNLGGDDQNDRVLSDSFSENWPNLKIYDLGQAPGGEHRAIGSQMVYNQASKQSLFFGTLTSRRFLTIIHLRAHSTSGRSNIDSYTVESTGTTEVQDVVDGVPREQGFERIWLSVPLLPAGKIRSERLMFATGDDYYSQLEGYGAAIRKLHHARLAAENLLGWWSWTVYYWNLNEGATLTNAQWMAQHLKSLGYNFFHIDEGYHYARGEYITADATKFPRGMRNVASEIRHLGLRLGIWTAPFEVADRSWVYEHHKEWLVHNAAGVPLQIISRAESEDKQAIFVLDTTHPGAQQYLRHTYETLVWEWGVRYIKLDFMDNTAVEGYYHRPHTTALEAQRIGLEIIRKTVGDDVVLDKDGSPMLNPVGLVDTGRVSADTGHSFADSKESAPGIIARYYMHRNFFVNDPDAFNLSRAVSAEDAGGAEATALSLQEAEVSIVLAAMSGGMFEIGDDLPRLGSEPDRLALVTNPDLLSIAKLGRAPRAVDLLTFSPEDEQPSILYLQVDERESMLAVFNWTDQPRSHAIRFSDLNLHRNKSYDLHDVLDRSRKFSFDGETLLLNDQPSHSVRLIKVINASVTPAAPEIAALVPARARVDEEVKFSCRSAEAGVPALAYHWDFGDGIVDSAPAATHAYTQAGTYTVQLTVDGIDGVAWQRTFLIAVEGQITAASPRRYVEPND
jgi:alpha-galactosidase